MGRPRRVPKEPFLFLMRPPSTEGFGDNLGDALSDLREGDMIAVRKLLTHSVDTILSTFLHTRGAG